MILSRRALLEEELARRGEGGARHARGRLGQRGARRPDRGFRRVRGSGRGRDRPVHVSEATHQRVPRLEDVVSPGRRSRSRSSLDEATGRISLEHSPGAGRSLTVAPSFITAGSVHRGTVRRVAEFGAFVEMVPDQRWQRPTAPTEPHRLAGRARCGNRSGSGGSSRSEPGRRRMSIQPVRTAVPEQSFRAGDEDPGTRPEGREIRVFPGSVRGGRACPAYSGTRKGTDSRRSSRRGRRSRWRSSRSEPTDIACVCRSGRRGEASRAAPRARPKRERESSRARTGSRARASRAATTAQGFDEPRRRAARSAQEERREELTGAGIAAGASTTMASRSTASCSARWRFKDPVAVLELRGRPT